jgi:alpha-D-xyloside xylohydrolase
MDKFRIIDSLKYRLMPYVYAQAKDCSEHGLPMVRALFVEYPEDPGSWLVDDEYLYGSSLLVAPLLHEGATGRAVYLPPGTWIDYQSGKSYSGGWQQIEAGEIPEIILVRDGTVIPEIKVAQSTQDMDWSKLDLIVFAREVTAAKGQVFLPGDSEIHEVTLIRQDGEFKLDTDPSAGRVTWNISAAGDAK